MANVIYSKYLQGFELNDENEQLSFIAMKTTLKLMGQMALKNTEMTSL